MTDRDDVARDLVQRAHAAEVRPDLDVEAGVRDVLARAGVLHPTAPEPVTSQAVASGARRRPLVRLPEMPVDEHLASVLDDPQVPERKRFCPNPACGHAVGRARNDRPGQAEGICPQCGTRFSFRPLLHSDELVGDGQFKVEGAIAHDGLGWVYRAWDRRVRRWVVLKGLIDPDDPDKRQAAVAELAALADANYPNIVTVHTVVRHPHPLTGQPVDYIVMEYLSGKSLQQLRQERPDSDPYLPVDQVCGYGLEVLAALSHLHEKRGLLYCDLSTDNVIHSTSGVKLIDLGAVRRIDDRDSPVYGKRGYQDPAIAADGPSVATDLYAVARMMAVLSFPIPGFSADKPIPGPDEVELLARYPSFYGLLRRATNPDPRLRGGHGRAAERRAAGSARGAGGRAVPRRLDPVRARAAGGGCRPGHLPYHGPGPGGHGTGPARPTGRPTQRTRTPGCWPRSAGGARPERAAPSRIGSRHTGYDPGG